MNSARSIRSIKVSRACAFTLVLLVVFVIQTVFAHKIEIFGVAPMLIFPATICVGMYGGHTSGMVFGLTLGLAVDATVGPVFGYYALMLMLIGILSGFFVEIVAWRRLLTSVIILATCYVIGLFAVILWNLIIVGSVQGLATTAEVMILELLYSAVLTAPCFYICRSIDKRYALQDD